MALPTTNLTGHWDCSDNAHVWTTHFPAGSAPTGHPASGGSTAAIDNLVGSEGILRVAVSVISWENDAAMRRATCKCDADNEALSATDWDVTSHASSLYLGASAKTLLIAFRLETETVPNEATVSANMTLVGDRLQQFGLYIKKPSGYELHAMNNDGGVDSVSVPISYATPHVACLRHNGTSLFLSVDGGTEVSVASGATASMANTLCFAKRVFSTESQFIGRIGEIATYNAALTGQDLTDALAYFTDRWLPLPVVPGYGWGARTVIAGRRRGRWSAVPSGLTPPSRA